ncbi:MAG: hypothetical protein WKG03_10130 [Telluria sp.]
MARHNMRASHYPRDKSTFDAGGGNLWVADPDVKHTLSTPVDPATGGIAEFRLMTPENDVEIYNEKLKLKQIRYSNGRTLNFSYSDATTPAEIAPPNGVLLTVTDDFGSKLQFRYDANGRMTKFIDPALQEFVYAYDTVDNLTSATYPDGNKRFYHYNEPAYNAGASDPAFGHLMTGISDEVEPGTLVRYSIYKYSSSGQPVSTELMNSVEKYVIDYGTNTVTDPLGTARNYGFTELNGVNLRTGTSQPGGAGCGPAGANTLYTSHGEVSEQTDFNQVVTRYEYQSDRSGLETRRTIALGKPEQRIVSTTWHPTLRLRKSIAEPKRITTYEYDSLGNVVSESVQATADLTGSQAFNAPLVGAPRKRTQEYNNRGQLLLAKGPRTDIVDETRYDYDSVSGNLNWIKNALGHVTLFGDYDAHGRARRITSPNGIITTLDYSSRGWLKSQTVSAGGISRTTSFTYDGVGLVKQVVLPGGATVYYSYDDARRLTGISDTLGNRITYILDAVGNRKEEKTEDPTGALTLQVIRVFDALNRLQQQTGAAQ